MENSLAVLVRYVVDCPDITRLEPKVKKFFLQALEGLSVPGAIIKENVAKLPCFEALQIIGEKKGVSPFSLEATIAYFLGWGYQLSFEEAKEGAKRMMAKIGLKEEIIEKKVNSLTPHFRLVHNHGIFFLNAMDQPMGLEVINLCLVKPAKVIEKKNDKARVVTIRIEENGGNFSIIEAEEEVLTQGVKVAPGEEITIHWRRICQKISPSQRKGLKEDLYSALFILNNRGQ